MDWISSGWNQRHEYVGCVLYCAKPNSAQLSDCTISNSDASASHA
jgi:hypothetical protein